jgi:hypothetical protein
MDILKKKIYQEWILGMVQKAIFCPINGTVLDIRTVVVVADSDGDPAMVFSPEAWEKIVEANALNPGYSLMEDWR